jgi:hypothetical protein
MMQIANFPHREWRQHSLYNYSVWVHRFGRSVGNEIKKLPEKPPPLPWPVDQKPVQELRQNKRTALPKVRAPVRGETEAEGAQEPDQLCAASRPCGPGADGGLPGRGGGQFRVAGQELFPDAEMPKQYLELIDRKWLTEDLNLFEATPVGEYATKVEGFPFRLPVAVMPPASYERLRIPRRRRRKRRTRPQGGCSCSVRKPARREGRFPGLPGVRARYGPSSSERSACDGALTPLAQKPS